MRRDPCDPALIEARSRAGWRALPAAAACVPPGLRSWLCERGSLSALLRAHGSELRVRRLGPDRLGASARAALAPIRSTPGKRPWTREVLLELDGHALVWACSTARPDALHGAWRGLRRVAGRPLGDWLFACPEIRRGAIELRRLAPAHALARRAWCRWRAHAREHGQPGLPRPTVLWARRSAFMRRGRALWVTELFHPDVARLRRR